MSNFTILLAQKEIRDRKRYTQKEIADETGVSQSMISRIANGKEIEALSVGKALLIAEWLGCNISELVYLDDEAEPA